MSPTADRGTVTAQERFEIADSNKGVGTNVFHSLLYLSAVTTFIAHVTYRELRRARLLSPSAGTRGTYKRR